MSKIRDESIQKALNEIGFTVNNRTDGKEGVHIRGSYETARKYIDAAKADKFASLSPKNAESAWGYLFEDEEIKFRGGTCQDLRDNLDGKKDLTEFFKTKEELNRADFVRRLKEKIATVAPRRARVMSEHDGDWSHDRKWEITPFESTHKKLGAGRSIQITVNLSVSWQATAENINKFGCFAWAISQIIEDCGINTEIVARFDSKNLDDNYTAAYSGCLEIVLKSPEQFVTPSALAGAFNTLLLRRYAFSMFHVMANLMGARVGSHMGTPDHGGFPLKWVASEGRLHLNIETIRAHTDEIEREIMAGVNASMNPSGL